MRQMFVPHKQTSMPSDKVTTRGQNSNFVANPTNTVQYADFYIFRVMSSVQQTIFYRDCIYIEEYVYHTLVFLL